MSPLHHQKRLQEARRLMSSKMMDAGTASQQVGYLSASQFSREYRRFFGSAPTRTWPICVKTPSTLRQVKLWLNDG